MKNRSLSPYDWPRRFTSLINDDFDRVFQSMFNETPSLQSFQVNCDVEETKDHYLLSFDMPGVNQDDIDVHVDGNVLTVSGERKSEERMENPESNYLKTERSRGSFHRAFTLPRHIDIDSIEANYENGVLELVLPKSAESKGRSIQIGQSKGGFFSRLTGQQQKTVNGQERDLTQ